MAAFLPTNTAPPARRKKAVTYGKAARPSLLSSPQLSDDAPPPEQPPKPVANTSGSLKRIGGTTKTASTPDSSRTATKSPDIFDVPSEDEFAPRPIKPANKLPAKSRILGKNAGSAQTSDALDSKSKTAKAPQPLRKPDSAKAMASVEKGPVKPAVSQKQVQASSSHTTAVPTARRAKTPQSIPNPVQSTTNAKPNIRPIAKPRAAAQVSKTLDIPLKEQSKSEDALKVTAKKQAKAAAMDVFDMPSSDEEIARPKLKARSQKPSGGLQRTVKPTVLSTSAPQKEPPESDESNASRGRKRKDLTSNPKTSKSSEKTDTESSLPRRGNKYQKKITGTSPGQVSREPSIAPVSKPKHAGASNSGAAKARARNMGAMTQVAFTKGVSSPASLGKMVPRELPSQKTPKTLAAEEKAPFTADDETMYEIPDALVTPARKSLVSTPGSVTPRQKDLFQGLLGESASKTPMSAMSSLLLTDRKPRSLLGELGRSNSDLTYSAQSRKTRLIDTLKRDQTSSEDESDSEEEETIIDHVTTQQILSSQPVKSIPKAFPKDMEIDTDTATESQTSQTASAAAGRPKHTYAKARSYLQEANFEDELMITMDLDEDLKLDSQSKGDTGTEDDEDPASQVRGHHELKKQGQYDMFYWDTEASIDDISHKTNNSIRRSAMIEFCTKMVDRTFVSQLLDSSLFQRFLKSMESNGDVVFDLTAAGAIIFVLRTDPTYTVLDQIWQPNVVSTLVKLLDNDIAIRRIARDRKTNASRIAQESIIGFSTLLQDTIWPRDKPKNLTPRLIAMKAIELAVLDLRKAGGTVTALSPGDILKTLNTSNGNAQDPVALELAFSILEAMSTSKQQQAVWSDGMLEALVKAFCIFFSSSFTLHNEYRDLPTLAIKLCMNMTNNKPKACRPFATGAFIQPLMYCITRGFERLFTENDQNQRDEVFERLLLTLGAMINLAELSGRCRGSCDDGDDGLLGKMVEIFLEGSERAAQAESVEESKSSVAVGYLTVLLGNICLDDNIRPKVCALLPEQRLDFLVEKIKEFVHFHEQISRNSRQYEGAEGQETWQNYTARLLLVAEKLEEAGSC